MFNVIPKPTFPGSLTIIHRGEKQTLPLVFRHKSLTEYQALMDQLREKKATLNQVVLQIVDSWEADVILNEEGLELLQEHRPGVVGEIITAYAEALTVSRKGN